MPPSLYAIVYFAKKDAAGIKERYVKSSAQEQTTQWNNKTRLRLTEKN